MGSCTIIRISIITSFNLNKTQFIDYRKDNRIIVIEIFELQVLNNYVSSTQCVYNDSLILSIFFISNSIDYSISKYKL